MPVAGEDVKRLGCTCGGITADLFTRYVCDTQQPFTHWMVEMRPNQKNGSLATGKDFGMTLYERAGTPANVRLSPTLTVANLHSRTCMSSRLTDLPVGGGQFRADRARFRADVSAGRQV